MKARTFFKLYVKTDIFLVKYKLVKRLVTVRIVYEKYNF